MNFVVNLYFVYTSRGGPDAWREAGVVQQVHDALLNRIRLGSCRRHMSTQFCFLALWPVRGRPECSIALRSHYYYYYYYFLWALRGVSEQAIELFGRVSLRLVLSCRVLQFCSIWCICDVCFGVHHFFDALRLRDPFSIVALEPLSLTATRCPKIKQVARRCPQLFCIWR